MAVLFTKEIVDAVIARIVGGTYSFTPKLVQEGDLAFWAENPTLTLDIPAVLVKALDSVPSCTEIDLGGNLWETRTRLRVVLVNSWTTGQDVVDLKMDQTEELVERFIGTTGYDYDFGASITGYTMHPSFPTNIDFEPPEDALVSLDKERRLWATAFELVAHGRATR